LGRFAPSRAKRFAVRTFAAAIDAFFARAVRSSAVTFFAAVLPPIRPNWLAISVMTARTVLRGNISDGTNGPELYLP